MHQQLFSPLFSSDFRIAIGTPYRCYCAAPYVDLVSLRERKSCRSYASRTCKSSSDCGLVDDES